MALCAVVLYSLGVLLPARQSAPRLCVLCCSHLLRTALSSACVASPAFVAPNACVASPDRTPSAEELRCLLLHDNCAITGVSCKSRPNRPTALPEQASPPAVRKDSCSSCLRSVSYDWVLDRLKAEKNRGTPIDISLWSFDSAHQPKSRTTKSKPEIPCDIPLSVPLHEVSSTLESLSFDKDWTTIQWAQGVSIATLQATPSPLLRQQDQKYRVYYQRGTFNTRPDVFKKICDLLDFQPTRDVFASPKNSLCKSHWTVLQNAFHRNWSDDELWICPPLRHMQDVVEHIYRDQARGIILIPVWHRCAWFHALGKIAVNWHDFPPEEVLFQDKQGNISLNGLNGRFGQFSLMPSANLHWMNRQKKAV